MNYTNQKAAIVSILRTNITKAKVVYDYAEPNPSGYPAITVESYDGSGVFADTGRNRRKRFYRITCLQERVKVGPSESERIINNLVDQIISTFDNRSNLSLSNTADFAYPIPSKFGYVQAQDIDIRSAEVIIEAESVE